MKEWVLQTMTSLGYWGIGWLMFLENLFPPIPSELIMPLAGFTIAQGKMGFVPAIAAGVIGTVVGALPWYYIGKLIGEENVKRLANKYGKWISVSGEDIDKANNWFNKHGEKAVFFGRLVPGVRTLISLPAGLNDMALVPFLIYSTVGTILWVTFLTLAGYMLGANYELVDEYLGPVSKIVAALLLVSFIVWIVRKKQKEKRNRSN
ncbi:MAG TPA: alkaline phosphatase [Cyanobacteria bacterium UBA11372]|nr:alkaline phosphatase [Cyanobacteria bacterium UBA11372]